MFLGINTPFIMKFDFEARLHVGCSIGSDVDQVAEWRAKGMKWFARGEERGYFFDGTKEVADKVHALA